MYLIAGLGNPGKKYENTRHNAGFRVIDALSEQWNAPVLSLRFQALLGRAVVGSEKVILCKPLTYMNSSGEAIRRIVEYYDIPVENVLVISDDVYLELGTLRIRRSGAAGGHNGLESIILELASDQFKRIRVGVGLQPAGVDLIQFVLSQMTGDELKTLAPVVKDAAAAAELIVQGELDQAMNRYNGKRNA